MAKKEAAVKLVSIKFTKAFGSFNAGDTDKVPESQADSLVAMGVADRA